MLGKDFLIEAAWSRICRHAIRSPFPKETTGLQIWHRYNVRKLRVSLLLQATQKPRRKHRIVFTVARLRRPKDDDQ